VIDILKLNDLPSSYKKIMILSKLYKQNNKMPMSKWLTEFCSNRIEIPVYSIKLQMIYLNKAENYIFNSWSDNYYKLNGLILIY